MARSSRLLMCSLLSDHCQPATTRQRQRLDGTLARRRWNLTIWVEGVVSIMSSPLIEMRLPSLHARGYELSPEDVHSGLSGNRTKRPCVVSAVPGWRRSKISCADGVRVKPSCPSNCPRNHATTGTLHVFPRSDRRRSWYQDALRSVFDTQGAV